MSELCLINPSNNTWGIWKLLQSRTPPPPQWNLRSLKIASSVERLLFQTRTIDRIFIEIRLFLRITQMLPLVLLTTYEVQGKIKFSVMSVSLSVHSWKDQVAPKGRASSEGHRQEGLVRKEDPPLPSHLPLTSDPPHLNPARWLPPLLQEKWRRGRGHYCLVMLMEDYLVRIFAVIV